MTPTVYDGGSVLPLPCPGPHEGGSSLDRPNIGVRVQGKRHVNTFYSIWFSFLANSHDFED